MGGNGRNPLAVISYLILLDLVNYAARSTYIDCTSRLSKLANKGTEGGGGDGHCSLVAEHWWVKPEALGLTSSGATSLSCLAVA